MLDKRSIAIQVISVSSKADTSEIESLLRQHSHVKEAFVLEDESDCTEGKLIAYIVGNMDALKTRMSQGSKAADAAVVDRWHRLYELTYRTAPEGPSFAGWTSSFSRRPIPDVQMHEWLQATLGRIRALRPRKVLEIGCGVGLVLQHLAPECESYMGTDFSSSALDRLRQWMSGRADFRHVRLLQCPANELQLVEPERFDVVVLNSVIQYFPDARYLLTVLQQAADLLEPGGKIFIGDVRHLGLLPMFHSVVQLTRAADILPVGHLRRRITRAIGQEAELAIDPQLFRALPEHVPAVRAVDVQLRRGRADNELTAYRYDVVLHTDEAKLPPRNCRSLTWQSYWDLGPTLEALLGRGESQSFCLSGVPNLRLARDRAAQKLIATSDSNLTVGALRGQLRDLEPDAVDPEMLWNWGEARGYCVLIDWGLQEAPERFEVQAWDCALGDRVPRADTRPERHDVAEHWANDPLENSLGQQLILKLREYLGEHLPQQRMPSSWMVLKQFPLTREGKIDRGAL